MRFLISLLLLLSAVCSAETLRVTTRCVPSYVESGQEYRVNIYATDGVKPYTWRVEGELPDGLTLTQKSSVATISGTFTGDPKGADACSENWNGRRCYYFLRVIVKDATGTEAEVPCDSK